MELIKKALETPIAKLAAIYDRNILANQPHSCACQEKTGITRSVSQLNML